MCQFFSIAKKGSLNVSQVWLGGVKVSGYYVLEIKTQNMKDIIHV